MQLGVHPVTADPSADTLEELMNSAKKHQSEAARLDVLNVRACYVLSDGSVDASVKGENSADMRNRRRVMKSREIE